MKIQSLLSIIFIGAVAFLSAHAQQTTVASPTGQLFEFSNFIVEQVSPAEISFSFKNPPPVDTSNPALRISPKVLPLLSQIPACASIASQGAKKTSPVNCPPASPATPNLYRVKIVPETKLSLRDSTAGTLAQFSAGDHVTVRGVYVDDGVVRGLSIKNISKPVEKNYVQINNVEVLGASAGNPNAFIVFRRTGDGCLSFADGKKTISCPVGIKSLAGYSGASKIVVTDRVKSYLDFAEKYEVRLTGTTSVLDRNRKTANASDISAGDKLNVYGVFLNNEQTLFEAEIVRDLSLPYMKPAAERYTGTIVQLNAGDGSFVLRTRDGRLLTAKNPFQTNSFVSIKGLLDEKTDVVSGLSEITVRDLTDADAVPVIAELRPGSGPIGTRVTIMGSGFTRTGNSINFAGVRNAIPNLPSPDGKSLSFVMPAYACPGGGRACSNTPFPNGSYELSVTNANGTSDVVKIAIAPLPPLGITTASLPQVVEQDRYSTMIEARGGIDSYAWSISSGALPPGLTLNQPVCVAAPCRIPVTITGIPSVAGTYTFTVTLQSAQEKVSKEFSIVVVMALSRGY